jgi:hypothetical protein
MKELIDFVSRIWNDLSDSEKIILSKLIAGKTK